MTSIDSSFGRFIGSPVGSVMPVFFNQLAKARKTCFVGCNLLKASEK